MSIVVIFWRCVRWLTVLGAKLCVRISSNSSGATVYPRQSGVTTGALLPAAWLCGLEPLSAWWVALGIDLERGRPGHPQDNGAHERMHQDISREVEALDNPIRRRWICGDRHLTTSGRTRLWGCAARVKSTPLQRENMKAHQKIWIIRRCVTRRVSHRGTGQARGPRALPEQRLAGWSVGLKPIAQDLMEVWFGRLLLGQMDLCDEQFYSGGYPLG